MSGPTGDVDELYRQAMAWGARSYHRRRAAVVAGKSVQTTALQTRIRDGIERRWPQWRHAWTERQRFVLYVGARRGYYRAVQLRWRAEHYGDEERAGGPETAPGGAKGEVATNAPVAR